MAFENSCIDLHMHTNASDGTDDAVTLLDNLEKAGIRTFAITDHDTFDGAEKMKVLLKETKRDFLFFPGIEFSCVSDDGKCHILGYCCNTEHEAFQAAFREGRERREKKLRQRLDFLKKNNIIIPEETRSRLFAMPSVGKPHLARLLMERGIANSIEDAIRVYINPCDTQTNRINAEMAIKAILASGGVPVWAHPLGGEGEKLISKDKFMRQFERLYAAGLKGLECCYSRYEKEERQFLTGAARERGLAISGGSDYHGKNKNIPLGMLGAEGEKVGPEVLTIVPLLKDALAKLEKSAPI